MPLLRTQEFFSNNFQTCLDIIHYLEFHRKSYIPPNNVVDGNVFSKLGQRILKLESNYDILEKYNEIVGDCYKMLVLETITLLGAVNETRQMIAELNSTISSRLLTTALEEIQLNRLALKELETKASIEEVAAEAEVDVEVGVGVEVEVEVEMEMEMEIDVKGGEDSSTLVSAAPSAGSVAIEPLTTTTTTSTTNNNNNNNNNNINNISSNNSNNGPKTTNFSVSSPMLPQITVSIVWPSISLEDISKENLIVLAVVSICLSVVSFFTCIIVVLWARKSLK